MSAIVPLTSSNLPAYLRTKNPINAAINSEIVSTGATFPVISIKGKVFTLVKNGERKVLTRPDDPEEVLQSLKLSVVRANTKSRVYYAHEYVEGAEGDAARPDCYTNDGISPAADARNPQSGKCATCPHAVWGTGNNGKGTACTVNTRLAVIDPDQYGTDDAEQYLLRVPAGSRANFASVVKAADNRGIPYNALVMRVGFDREAPSPKLTFKIEGLLSDEAYAHAGAAYDGDEAKSIVGLMPVEGGHDESAGADADLDAAISRKAQDSAASKTPAPAPAPAGEPSITDVDALLADKAPADEAAEDEESPADKAYGAAKAGHYKDTVEHLAAAFGDARMTLWGEACDNPDEPWESPTTLAQFIDAVRDTRPPRAGFTAEQEEALALLARVATLKAVKTALSAEAEGVEEAPAPAPKPAPKPVAKKAAKKAEPPAANDPDPSELLAGLDALLGSTDD